MGFPEYEADIRRYDRLISDANKARITVSLVRAPGNDAPSFKSATGGGWRCRHREWAAPSWSQCACRAAGEGGPLYPDPELVSLARGCILHPGLNGLVRRRGVRRTRGQTFGMGWRAVHGSDCRWQQSWTARAGQVWDFGCQSQYSSPKGCRCKVLLRDASFSIHFAAVLPHPNHHHFSNARAQVNVSQSRNTWFVPCSRLNHGPRTRNGMDRLDRTGH